MKTVTKTYNVYTFDELSESAKETALNEYRINGLDYDWFNFVYEDVKKCGRIIGINIDKIGFSGFWSQGDGAHFEGYYEYKKNSAKKIREFAPHDLKLIEIADALQSLQRKNFYKLGARVKQSGHYQHEMCTQIQVWSDNESMGGANDDAYYGIQNLLRDFMKWIYKRLEEKYENVTSMEYLKDMAEGNDWEFYESGKMA